MRSVLLTDGYVAYRRYTGKIGTKHAQCWSHSQRFRGARGDQCDVPEEEEIREKSLTGAAKQINRLTYVKTLIEHFFDWVDRELARQGSSNPYIQTLSYVRERRSELEVSLTDPDVPIDTNHIERALRVIQMGRKSWFLVAILDPMSRKVLSARGSNTMMQDLCVDALTEAIARYGVPDIVNTNQARRSPARCGPTWSTPLGSYQHGW